MFYFLKLLYDYIVFSVPIKKNVYSETAPKDHLFEKKTRTYPDKISCDRFSVPSYAYFSEKTTRLEDYFSKQFWVVMSKSFQCISLRDNQ